ncbi:MAG: rod-binding protein [Candidatus Poribacteria bacterium]|nr:rod-binding protein [Candidatus Poribacteria bacterium]
MNAIGFDGIAASGMMQADLQRSEAMMDLATKRAAETSLDPKDQRELMDAAKGFESIMINMLLKSMRQTVPKGGFIESSFASNQYEQMFDEHLSGLMASKGNGFGLAEALYSSVVKQEQGRKAYEAYLSQRDAMPQQVETNVQEVQQ